MYDDDDDDVIDLQFVVNYQVKINNQDKDLVMWRVRASLVPNQR